MNEQEIYQVVSGIVKNVLCGDAQSGANDIVPVEVSARHVHLTDSDVEALFGAGHKLTPKRELSQPGQFLAEERVTLVTAKGEFHNVAVLGPTRKHTQVELSLTDARSLGLNAPVRLSGDVKGCPAICILAGDKMLRAEECVMVAQNHIHMSPADAARYGVHDGQEVRVKLETSRPVTLDRVLIRVTETSALAMHVDFDEANACALPKDGKGKILK